MRREFTLIYWEDEGWLVGRLKEVPGVFSQGKTLRELEENVRDAYQLMMADDDAGTGEGVQTRTMEIDV